LIVFIIEMQSYIVPITIYYKGDRKDISAKEVNDHLEIILLETKFFGM
jgi:hypothetical protein